MVPERSHRYKQYSYYYYPIKAVIAGRTIFLSVLSTATAIAVEHSSRNAVFCTIQLCRVIQSWYKQIGANDNGRGTVVVVVVVVENVLVPDAPIIVVLRLRSRIRIRNKQLLVRPVRYVTMDRKNAIIIMNLLFI